MLPDSLSYAPEPVCHHHTDGEEVVSRTETAGGQVAAVLYGLIALGRGHILRHCGGWRPCRLYEKGCGGSGVRLKTDWEDGEQRCR